MCRHAVSVSNEIEYGLCGLSTIGMSMRCLIALCVLLAANGAQASVHQSVTFVSHGAVLRGVVVHPEGKVATAGVVLIHGSGPDGAEDYLSQAERFASSGVAALVYDKRGWNKSGGDWQHRPFALLGDDAHAAARLLRTLPEVPSDRVGYWGISQGGWVVAEAAARDPNTAFVIAVAATAVSPTSQELWHKEQLMRALGYSEKARSIALNFWRLAFDFLVKVDKGIIPLPPSVLVNERAGASTGLDYDPVPVWAKVRAPVLLLYGDRDLLEPARVSAPLIRAALTHAGQSSPTIRFFAASSHAITTRQTGLLFDWGESFHPLYYPTMANWIARPASALPVASGVGLDEASGPFQVGERYGVATPLRGALIQLPLLILLPLALAAWAITATIGTIRHGRSLQRTFDVVSAFGGLLIYAGVVTFILQSVFAQGLSPMPAYAIPTWQRLLPVAGSVVLGSALTTIMIGFRGGLRRGSRLSIIMGTALAAWLVAWQMFGAPI